MNTTGLSSDLHGCAMACMPQHATVYTHIMIDKKLQLYIGFYIRLVIKNNFYFDLHDGKSDEYKYHKMKSTSPTKTKTQK